MPTNNFVMYVVKVTRFLITFLIVLMLASNLEGLSAHQQSDNSKISKLHERINVDERETVPNDDGYQETVEGRVIDSETNQSLPGVNILIEGTSSGTATDDDGRFELAVPTLDETLIFTYIGYQTLEVPIDGRTQINVEMQPQELVGEEMVVIGYGVQDQRDVTGSISSVDTDQIVQRSPTNIFEAIQGQMAGVQITSNSGAPGESAQLRIRGISTFSAGVEPLYIVDGQPIDNIDNINPNDIESIEILKDGASAAIYGSRSANGVVLITTKNPEVGSRDIDISYNRSYSTVRNLPTMNTLQRIEYEVSRGIFPEHLHDDTRNQRFQNNTNYQDHFNRTAQKDEVNLNLSTGTENTRLFWNTGFLNQEGIQITTWYKRFGSRLNVDHTFNDRITSGLRLNFSYEDKNNIDPGLETDFIGQQLSMAAYGTIWDSDGSFLRFDQRHQRRRNAVDEYHRMKLKRRNLRGSIFNYHEISLLESLSYRANFGADINSSRDEDFFPEGVWTRNDLIQGRFASGLAWNWIHESYFNYDQDFDEHSLSGVGGFSVQRWGHPVEQIDTQLANSLIPTLDNAATILPSTTYTRDLNNHSLLSFFSRLNYSFRDRYLVSATIRRDGSSRFGPEERWANFPALSLGWRFSDESFMDGIGFIYDAKIRVSYAVTGNERIGTRDFATELSTGSFYGGVAGIGLSSRLGNPAIKWEETRQQNIGLDLSTVGGRLNFTIDYYVKNTDDLLADQLLPTETGLSNVRVNIGNVQNKGAEFAIQAIPYHRGNLMWRTNFNISTNVNEVTRLAGGTPIISNSHITQEGNPVGSFYGYTILGIFAYDESNAFTDDGVQLTPNFDDGGNFINYTLNGEVYNGNVNQKTVGGITSGGGDRNYRNLDDDFSIDGDDREILGNPFPKYFGGFRNEVIYRSISFSFLLDYQFDLQTYYRFGEWSAQYQLNSVTPPPYLWENRWRNPGDEDAIYPGGPNRSQNQLGASVATSEWVEDADFIKLRNIKLGYTLPGSLTSRLGITSLSIYSSITNALTWTNYRGFDPEVTRSASPLQTGVDFARYPHSREFIFGINIDF